MYVCMYVCMYGFFINEINYSKKSLLFFFFNPANREGRSYFHKEHSLVDIVNRMAEEIPVFFKSNTAK